MSTEKIVGDSPEHQVEKDAEAAQGRGLEEGLMSLPAKHRTMYLP